MAADQDYVAVRTTAPLYPPLEARAAILSQRLLLRPYEAADIDALRQLRLQPEVMQWTGQGKPDADLAATQAILDKKLSPHGDTAYEVVICDRETGRFLGVGGCHLRNGALGWPVIGYMFLSDSWGKGYATEFVDAFLQAYWALPREQVDLKVDKDSVKVIDQSGLVDEVIAAVTVNNNHGSNRVLEKTGWRVVTTWEEVDFRNPEQNVTLHAWTKRRQA